MKSQARERFWFPGIDAAIEKAVNSCSVCIQLKPTPPRTTLASWPHLLAHIHIDFFGPIHNKSYLVIVDAYSKWVECYCMNSNTTSKAVIMKLCEFMSSFGIPKIIASDNGTAFASKELKDFCLLNNIIQYFSPVYHPMSNGQAESFVKIVKRGLKCICILFDKCSESDMQNKLNKFLFDYRNSKNSTTDSSPAELVFGRKLRSRLDFVVPVRSESPPLSPLITCRKSSPYRLNIMAVNQEVLNLVK